jgi:PKD repeat protein
MRNLRLHFIYGFILILLFISFGNNSIAYDKKSLTERFTNCSCGPCAAINNSWYNATTANFINLGEMTHIVYNGDWPSPGECDPMHLLNKANNNNRISYYGVNAVPWIEVNGSQVSTSQGAFENAIANGNAEYAPFNIFLSPERFSNDVIDVRVKIIRDPGDITIFGDVKLRVALTEKQVEVIGNSCCNNGETHFYSVCRTMLPNATGTEFIIPAPGDSIELSLLYIPTAEFLAAVNLDSIRVVAFIQSDDSKEVYQSVMTDLEISDRVNAAFRADESLGAAPFIVSFSDYSTATTTSNITSWEWDFNNDGTIDSNDPEPTWTFNDEQSYTVSLTVSDGTNQHTRTLNNYITVLGSSSDILVVNGIAYATYGAEMENFYNNSACFGNHQVDIWDLFGDQGFDYSANSNIMQINLLNRDIPNSILSLYDKVIWIGNSYSGDEAFYDPEQVLSYISEGGNFLLATREGADFFDTALLNYCGISSVSGLRTITELIALDNNLVNMPALAGHTRVQYVTFDASSEAIPIFDADTSNTWIAGFRIQKDNDGPFIYIAGRPYRFDNNASSLNYDYIIDNWMNFVTGGVEDESESRIVKNYQLMQNYPNPFNPETIISYSIANPGFVLLKVYDMLGREVQTLVNEFQSAKRYSISFDASDLSSGVYFYKLQAGDFLEFKKMILIK